MQRRRIDGRALARGARCTPRGLALTLLALACAAADLAPIGSRPGRFEPTRFELALQEEDRLAEQTLESAGALLRDAELERYLEGIAARLLAGRLEATGTSVRVRVLRDPTPNAHALAHGTVILHTGLLARLRSEAQLAAVIAHELVHLTHRHAARQARALEKSRAPIRTLSALANGVEAHASPLARVRKQLSRELEAEADREGLGMLLAAGWPGDDVVALLEALAWEREALEIEARPLSGSHPELEARIARHRLWVGQTPGPPGANGARLLDDVVTVDAAGTPLTRSERRLLRAIDEVLLADATLNLERGELRFARHELERLLSVRPGNARAWYGLGEIARREGNPSHQQRRRAYERAAQRDPSFPDPHRALALLELERRHAGAARPHLERYLALAPAAPDAAILRGLVAEAGPRYSGPPPGRARGEAPASGGVATIALAPVLVPSFVENAEPLRHGFEALIAAGLEHCGYRVVRSGEVQAAWDWMLARLGDYRDAQRGGFDEERLDVARALTRWELARSFGADALLDPRIELVDADFDGRAARWMGTSVELAPGDGEDAAAPGARHLKASALHITIDGPDARVWLRGSGAIEVVERVGRAAPGRPLFADAARNRSAVERALASLPAREAGACRAPQGADRVSSEVR